MKDRVIDPGIALAGRRREVELLAEAFRARASRLITGAAGIGKTRLVEETLTGSGEPFVFIKRPARLHDLLVTLAEQLECRSPRFPQLCDATSLHLKPLVLNMLRASPRCVILDEVETIEPRMYRFLQELYYIPGACLVVTARSRTHIGHLAKLMWDPREEMLLEPLANPESRRLFADACRFFGLEWLNLEDFRVRAIRAARGNPGQIVGMCRLAAQPEYHSGKHIKFAPLRIDLLAGFLQ